MKRQNYPHLHISHNLTSLPFHFPQIKSQTLAAATRRWVYVQQRGGSRRPARRGRFAAWLHRRRQPAAWAWATAVCCAGVSGSTTKSKVDRQCVGRSRCLVEEAHGRDLHVPPRGPAGDTAAARIPYGRCGGGALVAQAAAPWLSGSDIHLLQLVWRPWPWSSVGHREENGPCLQPCCHSTGPAPWPLMRRHRTLRCALPAMHLDPLAVSPRTAGCCSFAHLAGWHNYYLSI